MALKSLSKKEIPIVAFDMDGHWIRSEELASVAYYEAALEAFADDEHAIKLIKQKLAPENDGAIWFSNHIMGHSHNEIRLEINREFELKNSLTPKDLKPRYMEIVDTKITDQLTPEHVFAGIAPMLAEMQRLHRAGKINFIIISGSALKRIKNSLINTGLMQYIDDFDRQVYSGEKDYKSKDELMTRLCTNAKGQIDLSRIIYSGDGYGDAKSCNIPKLMETKHDYDGNVFLNNIYGEKRIFFIGKSEGAHCVGNHKEKLQACGVDVMTTSGWGLFNAVRAWLADYNYENSAEFGITAAKQSSFNSHQHVK